MKKRKLMQATRELRNGIGVTQTEFGRLIGKTLATIQRYETLSPPRGEALAALISLAEKHERHDLAAVFNKALGEELGLELPTLIGSSWRLRRDVAVFKEVDRRIAAGETNEQISAALARALKVDADSIQMMRKNKALLAELGKEADK